MNKTTNITHNNNTTKSTKTQKNGQKKIINWPKYNKALKNRGNLSIFISDDLVKDGQIVSPRKTGKAGRPLEYTVGVGLFNKALLC